MDTFGSAPESLGINLAMVGGFIALVVVIIIVAMSSSSSNGDLTVPADAAPPKDYQLIKTSDGHCLYWDSMSNPPMKADDTCENPKSQWLLDGALIKNKSSNTCLNRPSDLTFNGARVDLSECNQHNSQNWIYDPTTKQIKIKSSPEKCMFWRAGQTAIWDCIASDPVQQFSVA